MKRLLPLLLLLLPALALAQTWTLPTPTVTGTLSPGGTIQIKATFIASSAITASLNIEVHDPGNTKVLPQNWVQSVAVPGGLPGVSETLTWTVPATAVVGSTYSIGFGAYSATNSGNLAWNQGTTFKIVAAGSSAPPVTVPPPVTTAPAATFTPVPPNCWPKPQLNALGLPDSPMITDVIPAGIESATNPLYDHWAAYVCNFTDHYETIALLYKASLSLDSTVFSYEYGNTTAAQLNAMYVTAMTANGPYTAAEQSFVDWLIGWHRPILTVAYGASTNIFVYGLNADGTVNLTPVANEAVAPGTRCNEAKKIQTVAGLIYFDVSGAPNSLTGGTPSILPAGTYASVCTIYAPSGVN